MTVGDQNLLADRFQEHRPRLRAVAYRMLGSLAEADDALQDAWLRASAADTSEVRNFEAWFTTVVSRVCLNLLRSRETRKEDSLEVRVPDPVVGYEQHGDPEYEAMTADSVGLALLVVLDTLGPAERLAYVLHDMFQVTFEEIADVIDKTPAATRQLASRARRRVEGQAPTPDQDLTLQRKVVDAFFAASRLGDFQKLVSVLHPDVVLRSDGGVLRARQTAVLTGAQTVASQATLYRNLAPYVRPVFINGLPGVFVVRDGEPLSLMAFTVSGGKVVAIDVIVDPERLAALEIH